MGHSPYEALIVASLVEEEAKVDEDRPKIARVIYNRLAQGMPLGVDATLCYQKDERPCVLHESDPRVDLAVQHAQEHRPPADADRERRAGRPSTPRSTPIRATSCYYVLDPNLPPGQHLFTASAAEFEAAKARCKAAGLGCD